MIHFLLLLLASTSLGQDCPTLNVPKLCGSESVVVNRNNCNSTFIDFPEMAPCCRLQTERPSKCDDPDATQSCRSLQVSPALCVGQANSSCCAMPTLSMKLYFEFEQSNSTCCHNCRCYGDPHCESFAGKPDTWVICDARTPKPSNKAMCPMSQTTCASQLDHTGNPCRWIQTPTQARTWSIALNGSPCRAANTTTPPQMSMYKTDDFNILLNMGERSIIQDLIIIDKQNKYVLSADLCYEHAFTNQSRNPWRTNFGPSGILPNDPSWLPKSWLWSPVDGKDVLWQVTGLQANLDISVRCTRTPELVNKKVQYGQPRLNVDITEAYNFLDSDVRPNAAGFCVDNEIKKLGSTSNTDMIVATSSCVFAVDDLAAAQILCNPAVTKPGVEDCKLSWCHDHLPPQSNDVTSSQQCVQDISTFGWDVMFCTLTYNAKQTQSGGNSILPSECRVNNQCNGCLTDIMDDGLASAVLKYDSAFDPSGPCETTIESLPLDFVGPCQKGAKVQYYNSFLGEWATKFVIPSGTCIANGYLEIPQTGYSDLFANPMRIIQCSSPQGACLENKCTQEIGFKAAIKLETARNDYANIFDLFQQGELVCNPNFPFNWQTPTQCVDQAKDIPHVCPCPA